MKLVLHGGSRTSLTQDASTNTTQRLQLKRLHAIYECLELNGRDCRLNLRRKCRRGTIDRGLPGGWLDKSRDRPQQASGKRKK
jgi:hypothetical protein